MSEGNPRNPTATEPGLESAEESFFSSEPRSFKMDRKSPEASKLRASITEKLFEFLGNYSDDVLAEYIVVLVCNGKHQKQARDDLEAFLGEGSAKFVAWLWHHLSEEILMSKAPFDSSSLEVEVTNGRDDIMRIEHKNIGLADLQTSSAAISNIPLSKTGNYEPLIFSEFSKAIDESESLQRWCPSADNGLTEMNTVGTSKETCTISKNSGASRVRFSPENSSGRDRYLQYENQVQKIAKGNSSDVTYHHLPVPKSERVARNLKSIITEDLQPRSLSTKNAVSGRLPSAAMDAVSHQIARPRGNVWDRLGKPGKGDEFTRQDQNQHDLDVSEMENVDNNGKVLQKLRSRQVVPDAKLSSKSIGETAGFNSHGRVIPNNHSNEHRIHDNNLKIVGSLDHDNNTKRKRQFGDISSGGGSAYISRRKESIIRYKVEFPALQGSLPINDNSLQTSNEFTSEAKSATTLISEAKPGLDVDKATRSQLDRRASATIPMQNLVLAVSPVAAKSEHVVGAEDGKANHRPMQDEVLDVKSRLRQVEMNMLKLRSKHAEMSIDAKVNASSGSQNHSEEDIESRTVLATNVHFAASREALLSHFTKCGVVLKVILLTDTVTAQPKGAAYIVFASRESVDKALSMSGTSFFSRILTVMRKADMPSGFLVPAQLTGKPLQSWYPQPHAKAPVQRQHSSSHLQWRRDQPASRENPIPAATTGLGSSDAGE